MREYGSMCAPLGRSVLADVLQERIGIVPKESAEVARGLLLEIGVLRYARPAEFGLEVLLRCTKSVVVSSMEGGHLVVARPSIKSDL